MKTPLEIRPVYHRLEDRVRAHVFICMLACYVQFELARRLAPLLFADDTPLSAADPVAPANAPHKPPRRPAAAAPPTARSRTASRTCSQTSARCAATSCGSARASTPSPRLTTATELQASAFELLGIKPK